MKKYRVCIKMTYHKVIEAQSELIAYNKALEDISKDNYEIYYEEIQEEKGGD